MSRGLLKDLEHLWCVKDVARLMAIYELSPLVFIQLSHNVHINPVTLILSGSQLSCERDVFRADFYPIVLLVKLGKIAGQVSHPNRVVI